jgi:uncharacterized phage protein gp47/JayE
MKKNTLYFYDNFGEQRVVTANLDTIKEIIKNIYSYVAKLNPDYQIYYTRRWKDDNDNIWFDVGSHTEFFVLKGEAPEDEQEAQKVNTSPTEAKRKKLYYRPE